jgi:hypothetical protein
MICAALCTAWFTRPSAEISSWHPGPGSWRYPRQGETTMAAAWSEKTYYVTRYS